jgi:hypothetical protein
MEGIKNLNLNLNLNKGKPRQPTCIERTSVGHSGYILISLQQIGSERIYRSLAV